MQLARPCPCGSGTAYDACCGRLHRGAAQAATAEELMRSRYAAYAVGDLDHVFRTWHPRTRPDDLAPDPDLTWTGLRVLGAGEDWVEFVASFARGGATGELRERSRFERRGGRWVYVDGVEGRRVHPLGPVEDHDRDGRDRPLDQDVGHLRR